MRTEGPSDVAVLFVIGALASVCALVWVWGGVAGVVFGGGWPRGGAGDLVTVLVRLPARLGDPARAWPATARAQLPGPGGFYAALGLLAAAAWLPLRLGLRGIRGRSAGARWAAPRELRGLRSGVASGRLTLGHHHGRLVRAEERHALVAFGPPQSGKSAGLAIPALLEWDGPAVASSIKTDLLGATIKRRQALGKVLVFDPFELAGTASHTWSPLQGARTWDGALEVAWRLAAAGELRLRMWFADRRLKRLASG